MKMSILFICTHNSARSQIAEGLVNALYGDRYLAKSAGTIATKLNPFAVKVMNEIGIDISYHRSKSIEEFKGKIFDVVVTVCDNAKETCPFFPGKRVLHKGFDDPSSFEGSDAGKSAVFRKVRDEIKNWIEGNLI